MTGTLPTDLFGMPEVEVLGLLAIKSPRVTCYPYGEERGYLTVDAAEHGLTLRGWGRYTELLDRPLNEREQFHREWEVATVVGGYEGMVLAEYDMAAQIADVTTGMRWGRAARMALGALRADPDRDV